MYPYEAVFYLLCANVIYRRADFREWSSFTHLPHEHKPQRRCRAVWPHTYTHTHICARARTHAGTLAHAQTHTHTHTHPHPHPHPAHPHPHSHLHTPTQTHTLTHPQTHTRTHHDPPTCGHHVSILMPAAFHRTPVLYQTKQYLSTFWFSSPVVIDLDQDASCVNNCTEIIVCDSTVCVLFLQYTYKTTHHLKGVMRVVAFSRELTRWFKSIHERTFLLSCHLWELPHRDLTWWVDGQHLHVACVSLHAPTLCI